MESEPINTPTKPGEGLAKIGGIMIGLCIACLLLGRVVITLFFPEMKGKGIQPGMWYVLIPIWSIGIIGLLLILVGWIRSKFASSPDEDSGTHNDDKSPRDSMD